MQNKKIFISGSIAYDDIRAVGETEFKRFYGGCAGNIAYNLNQLKTPFILHGIVGDDFTEYRRWFNKNKISSRDIVRLAGKKTARAVVMNLARGKQIVDFIPTSQKLSQQDLKKITKAISTKKRTTAFAIISPDLLQSMTALADACKKNAIPYFFDPGPLTYLFKKSVLQRLIRFAYGIFANEDEIKMILKATQWSMSELLKIVPLIIITKSSKGSEIYFYGKKITILPIKTKKEKDPTGCGDAYRAGLLSVLLNEFPHINETILKRAGAKGSALATKCLEHVGTQCHVS